MKEGLAEIVGLTRKYLEQQLERGTETLQVATELVAKLDRAARPAEGVAPHPLCVVEREALKCVKCQLHETRTSVVFGEGDPDARLMFVGEAPGRDEDLQSRPFVGRAGQLLTRIIESIDLTREKVYIANVLKCRPPKNRNPLPDEISCCLPYLTRQIEIIQPRIICALGAFAAQTLVGSSEGIGKLRGRFYDYQGAKLMPTFHPAACLRNPNNKKYVWQDMKQIREEYFRR